MNTASSLPELLVARAARTPTRVAWRQLTDGVWVGASWAELEARAAGYAAGFAVSGVEAGARVAMVVGPGMEATAASIGLLGLGAVVVSVHPGRPGPELGPLLADAGTQIAIAEDAQQLELLLAARASVPQLREVIVVDARGVAGSPDAPMPLVGVIERSHESAHAAVEAWRESVARLAADAPAVVALTVGGAGVSRPVVLTHANLVAATRALADAVPIASDDEILSYLPPSHVLERVLSTGVAPLVGAVVNVGGGPGEVFTDLRSVRPTVLLGVPGLWDGLADRLDDGRARAGRLKRRVLERGLRRGRRRLAALRTGARRGRLEGWLSTRPARARLGLDRARVVLSALAPLGAGTADALGALGVVIRQCYGTAEACGLLTVEPADGVRPASVGLPVAATELRVDDRGELLARGPQIARETLDGEGWLHTGDRARVDEASRVHLEGRVEDLIVTASGEEVDATAVARAFVGGRLVHRVVVTGDGRTGVGALLELEPNALGTWMAEQTPTSQDPLGQSQLHEELEREVATANDELPPDTQVQRFLVLPGPLEVDAELTGTRRLRRAVAIRSHADLVDELYGP